MTKEEYDAASDDELRTRFVIAFLNGFASLGQRYDTAIVCSARMVRRLQAIGAIQQLRGPMPGEVVDVLVQTTGVAGSGMTHVVFRVKSDNAMEDGKIFLEAPAL